MARKEKFVQFNHKVPTVSWRQPEHDSHERTVWNVARNTEEVLSIARSIARQLP